SETLRLNPILIGLQRQAECSVSVGDWQILRGEIASPAMYLLHRDARYWGADADTFKCGRDYSLQNKAYFPFGLGPRACIGSMLGKRETKLAVSMVITRLGERIRPRTGYQPRTLRRGDILAPSEGLPMVIDK